MEEELFMIGDATPIKDRRVDSWCIDEPDVLSAILQAGYNYIHENYNWYDSDIPVPDEGAFALPDGRLLYADGSSLTLLTKEQRQQKALDEFDARLAKVREEHGAE